MNLPKHIVLRGIKQFYRTPEIWHHWYLTYLNHHLEEVQISWETEEPCLFVRRDPGKLSGMVVRQMGDRFSTGGHTFIREEEKTVRQLKTRIENTSVTTYLFSKSSGSQKTTTLP